MKSSVNLQSIWPNKKMIACACFLLPSFLGVMLFVILPSADVIRRSFLTAVTEEAAGFGNYLTIISNEAFRLAVKNTLRFTLVCIPLLVLLGLCIAAPLCNRSYTRAVRTIYLLPLAIPTAAVVLVWKMIFYERGYLNLLLSRFGEWSGLFGEVSIDYLETGLSFYVLVASYLWKNMGYTVVLWLAGIMSISTEIKEAARTDGAGKIACFIYVILPNLQGTLYTILILSFLNSFKVYREAYLVVGAYPEEQIYLLQHLFNNWFVNMDFDKMAAAAVCMGVFLFAVIWGLQRAWDKQ